MITNMAARIREDNPVAHVPRYMRRPWQLFQSYDRTNFRPDLIAGITVAVILLPQAIAFALIAELPPEMGLYAAVVGAFVGAFWGSSNQIHTGPTNAISLLVFSTLSSVAVAGATDYIIAAGMLALMVGVFQVGMGLARLGVLVNFVSHSVIVGFASGAGILIGIKQLNPLLGLSFPSHNLLEAAMGVVEHLGATHPATAMLGIGTMILIIGLRKLDPRLPAALISMVVASIVVFVLHLDRSGVAVIGQLPSSLPPLARLPIFDLTLIVELSTGALAVGAIGLVETTAISRSIATQTGQRLDSNQEFVGQGMANIFAGLFSGYACAGSFSRSAVNFKAGAKTPMAAIFSGIFVLIAMFVLAPLAVYLPRAALAGVLIITAYGMIDRPEIQRIWQSNPGDALIMVVTLAGTLFLEIEFAVLVGILLSLAVYIMRTSTPRVHSVLPDESFKHFTHQPEKSPCPQLGIIEISGDLYFGAVNHVEEVILHHADAYPDQRFLLLRMHFVNHCDFSGIHMLESVVRTYRDRGGDVFLVRISPAVRQLITTTHFDQYLGRDHFLDEDEAIAHIFHWVLNPAICIYECPVRAFKECQNLPKRIDLEGVPLDSDIPAGEIDYIESRELWKQISNGYHPNQLPLIVDVREPREFRLGHIPEARLVPLPSIINRDVELPRYRPLVLVCGSGRRSRRVAHTLQQRGHTNISVLRGGMAAWEAEQLLEAIETRPRYQDLEAAKELS